MPRSRSLFSTTLSALQRSEAFISAVEGRIRANGQFAMDPGEPVEAGYVFRDEKTQELIKLWRTHEDVERQLRYKRYRKAVKMGVKSLMMEDMPELFAPDERHKRPQDVRSYDMTKLISTALTALTCGGGVTLETGIDMIDDLLEDLKIARLAVRWSWQASVYEFVGVKVEVDPARQTLSVVKVWPDYLFLARDPHNPDEIEYISQKTWMPLERVVDWTPISVDVSSLSGAVATTKAKQRGAAGTSSQVFELAQDGFVLEERHYRGWVEYHFWAVAGDRILSEVPLAVYDREIAANPVFFTGMRDFAITIFPNVGMGDDRPVSDWDELLDPSIEFSRRATQNSRLVDRYSHPREVLPSSHVQVDPITGKAVWGMGDQDVVITRPSDHAEPSFLQPNANFDAPKEDLQFTLSMLGILSQARYAIDPEVLEQVDTGVALKLKMAPAMAKVETRREAQVDALRSIVYNILSGVEYMSSKPVDEYQDARQKAYLGVLHWRGPVADAVESISDEMRAEGKMMRDVHYGGAQKVSIKRLKPIFAHIDTSSADESAEREVRAARAKFLVDADLAAKATEAEEQGLFDKSPEVKQAREAFNGSQGFRDPNAMADVLKEAFEGEPEDGAEEAEPKEAQPPFGDERDQAPPEEEPEEEEVEEDDEEEMDPELEGVRPAIAPFDPDDVEVNDQGEPMVPGQQIGQNIVNPQPAPEMITVDELQRASDALYVTEAAMTKKQLKIRMAPGLPQDHAEASERVSTGTMSLFRFLTEYDGLTDDEAEAEIQRIGDEQSNSLTGDEFDTSDPFGGDGPGGEGPATEAEVEEARIAITGLRTRHQDPEEVLRTADQVEQDLMGENPEGANDQNENVGQTLQPRAGEV